jgi:hypothetical protein
MYASFPGNKTCILKYQKMSHNVSNMTNNLVLVSNTESFYALRH